MSCKGLRNSALRKCMKKYVQESKKRFPTFNKEQIPSLLQEERIVAQYQHIII